MCRMTVNDVVFSALNSNIYVTHHYGFMLLIENTKFSDEFIKYV